MQKPLWAASLAAVLLALGSVPVEAHKLNVLAWTEGNRIEGEAYYRGRVPVRAAEVTVEGPGGQQLGRTRTDDQGRFRFEPRIRCDHRFTVDAGDGHRESYVLAEALLPASLPSAPPDASVSPEPVAPAADEPRQSPDAAGPEAFDPARLEAQINQLRRELHEFKSEVRFRDVVGGLGYIVGLMGLSFYFLGVRRLGRQAGGDQATGNQAGQ